jgi:adenylate cyclase
VTDEYTRRFGRVRRAVSALDRILLRGPRRWSRRDLEQRRGVPSHRTDTYWRSMGYLAIDDSVHALTDEDADAIVAFSELVDNGTLNEAAYAHMTRGLAHHLGRLALWQVEALVELIRARDGVDDAAARIAMLELLPDLLDPLERQVRYQWHRQLASTAARAGAEILQSAPSEHLSDEMPLLRCVGFADLVSFTQLAQSLEGDELAGLIQRFEAVARDIVSVGGGRVVKTVGDEIMFIADTPEDGVQIALSMTEQLMSDPDIPDVRAAVVWGTMLSRFGDVFGPTVNLAARLEGVAEAGTVLTDVLTARAVEESLPGAFEFEEQESVSLKGLGEHAPYAVTRGESTRLIVGG